MKNLLNIIYVIILVCVACPAFAQDIANWQGAYQVTSRYNGNKATCHLIVTKGPVAGQFILAYIVESKGEETVLFLLGEALDNQSLSLRNLKTGDTLENIEVDKQVVAEAQLTWSGNSVAYIDIVPQASTTIPYPIRFVEPSKEFSVGAWNGAFLGTTQSNKYRKINDDQRKQISVQEVTSGLQYRVTQGTRYQMTVEVGQLASLRPYIIDNYNQRKLSGSILAFAFPVVLYGKAAVIFVDSNGRYSINSNLNIFEQDTKNMRIK